MKGPMDMDKNCRVPLLITEEPNRQMTAPTMNENTSIEGEILLDIERHSDGWSQCSFTSTNALQEVGDREVNEVSCSNGVSYGDDYHHHQVDRHNPFSFLGVSPSFGAPTCSIDPFRNHTPNVSGLFHWIRRIGKPASRELAPIVVSNHVSYTDPIFFFYELFPSIVASETHDKIPVVGTIIRAMQVIYVDRFSSASRKRAVTEIKASTSDYMVEMEKMDRGKGVVQHSCKEIQRRVSKEWRRRKARCSLRKRGSETGECVVLKKP